MNEELVIGFDCRAVWLTKEEFWPVPLLKPAIERWLSIGRGTWPTVFLFRQVKANGKEVGTAPDCHLEIPPEHRTRDGFCDDLEAMQAFMEVNRESFQRECWMIALTVVPT